MVNKETIFRSALNAIHYSGIGKLAGPAFKGNGAYLMLHHILPGGGLQTGFAPNAGLEITPQFLGEVIQFVRQRGYQIVSIDESHKIITGEITCDKPFIVFTIDDGYRDNLIHALPVFQQHNCPFTIFIAPQITSGTSELWWRGLEQVVADNDCVKCEINGQQYDIASSNTAEEKAAFAQIYWPVRNLPEYEQRIWIRQFCNDYGIDLDEMCASQAMNWDEVRQISSDPLCTIGAHTINHYAVSKLTDEQVRDEVVSSGDIIEQKIGKRPEFFAYPYGDEGSAGPRDFQIVKDAGFKLAVTTRKGVIYDEHADHLTALPRLSLNGAYQETHYVEALLSGVPFALFNKFKKLNVA